MGETKVDGKTVLDGTWEVFGLVDGLDYDMGPTASIVLLVKDESGQRALVNKYVNADHFPFAIKNIDAWVKKNMGRKIRLVVSQKLEIFDE